MAVNKNFTVRNGLEVNTKLILADANTNKVGIGSTGPRFELDVAGGIGATTVDTNSIIVSGISTVLQEFNVGLGGTLFTATVNSVGIGTAIPAYVLDVRSPVSTGQTALYVYGDLQVTGDLSIDDIVLDQANINRLYVSQNLDITGAGSLFVESGISTFNGYVDINSNTDISGTLNVGGATTLGGYVDINNNIDATGTVNIGGATTVGGYLDVNAASDISGTVNIGGATTIGGYLDVNADTDINGTLNVSGITTLGSVLITSGIVTATSPSGIVTYYGDGSELLGVIGGIGIGTTGGLVGYGITFLNLFGAGVSTTQYDSSVGIATIFFEGGGGGGSISISTVAPTSPGSGDLWYSPDYGRTFIYYDETVVGYGTDAYWVDAAPFNTGIDATLVGVAFSAASAVSPSLYFAGDVQTGFFSPTPGQFTVVSTGSSILNVNPSGVKITGIITATNFVGNGSGLIGVTYASTAGIATYSGTSGIATYATTAGIATYSGTSGIATYATSSGVSTSVLGGNAGINTTTTPTNLYVSGTSASNIVGLGTTNANTTLNFSSANDFSFTLTGSIVLANPTGVTTGQSGVVYIQQDGVGSRTVGFGSHWDFPSATAPTLSTAANALDVLTYSVRTSTSIVAVALIGIGTL